MTGFTAFLILVFGPIIGLAIVLPFLVPKWVKEDKEALKNGTYRDPNEPGGNWGY
jgi:hypothetical protein